MTIARTARLVVTVALALCLALEVGRYRAERRLYRATAALRIAVVGGAPERREALAWAQGEAAAAARLLPGDPRPLVAAGSARLAARDADGALEWYRLAFAVGERAETDLNFGRALMMQHDLMGAQRAFLRAGWLSPLVLGGLPEVARAPLLGEIERLTRLLEEGRLREAPPPPVGRPSP